MLDGPVEGRTILVSGGAGAVSHYAIQFARAAGATVLTTVSGPEKAVHAEAAGAQHVINYRTENVGDRVKAVTGGAGCDRVIELDITANARLLPDVLAPRGTVVVYGIGGPEAALPAPFCLFASATVKFFLVYELTVAERATAVAGVNGMLAAGRLQNAVGLSLPLDRVAEAHEAVEQGGSSGTSF